MWQSFSLRQPLAQQYRHGRDTQIPSPGTINRPLTDWEIELAQYARNEQRRIFGGFTLRQLEDLGCWDKPDAKLNDLTCPISPVFQRSKWRSTIPSGDPEQQIIDIDDEFVWEALVPCLRMASTFLEHQHLWPWLFEFICGPWTHETSDGLKKRIGSSLERPSKGHYTFGVPQRRPQSAADPPRKTVENSREEYSNMLKAMEDIATFQFVRSAEAKDPESRFATSAWATQDPYGRGTIHIPEWLVNPLISSTLTASEKAHHQFSVASTLTHELMFYNEEYISEVGYSWEAEIFGGTTSPSIAIPKLYFNWQYTSLPLLSTYVQDWPSWKRTQPDFPGRELLRYPDKYGKGSVHTQFPTPTWHLENISQQEFWNVHVKSLGKEALRIPRIFGTREIREGMNEYTRGQDWDEMTRGLGPDHSVPPPPLNATATEKWKYEQRCRSIHGLVRAYLGRQKERMREAKLRDAIDAYSKSDSNTLRKLLADLPLLDDPSSNIQISTLLWSFFMGSENKEEREISIKEGKRAKKSLVWFMTEAFPALKDKRIEEILDQPTSAITALLMILGEILKIGKHITAQDYTEGNWKKVFDVFDNMESDNESSDSESYLELDSDEEPMDVGDPMDIDY
ncbi:hypothetical protein HYFRA_00000173 [Hymenoscyphus fraxineus]|uniref:Uncharacterized protein n=1 Tax=Hymenoscyphus fraxineus TaxID=746836 RepID=A0A9N9PWI8_9HELO|nr:hypothetical protein HYFRA_00000173 [Hymenoscyphus fraxineus]